MRRFSIMALLTLTMVFCFAFTAFAVEDQNQESAPAEELTLDTAITNALKNSFDIQQAELDVDRANEVRDSAWDNFGNIARSYRPTQELYIGIPDNGDDNSFFQALSADRAAFIQKKSYEIRQDAINSQVTQIYYDILQNQKDLDLAKLKLEIAERDYRVAQIQLQVGVSTGADVQAKKAALEGAKSALESAQSDLENSYRSLNKLMGKKDDFRPQLTTAIEFEKLEVPSLDAEIIRAMNPEQNPYLWSKKEGYELQKYSWTTTQPEEAGKVDIDKAKLTYEEARVETRNTMNELYNTLKTLEATYESATQALATAELGLKNTQALYDTGMATKDDVIAREKDIAQTKVDLLDLKIKYELSKINFEKPWLSFMS